MAPKPHKQKATSLSFKQKLKVLQEINDGKSRKQLSIENKCNISTITRIVQNEKKLKELQLKNENMHRKRIRHGRHIEVEKVLSKWFHENRAKDGIVTGPLVIEKAKEFSQMLGCDDFEPNNGWLHRWQKRNNIMFKKLHGKKTDSDKQSAHEWTQNVMPDIVKGYTQDCIYNADETGLFYKASPKGTLAVAGEKVLGGKLDKSRLTLLFMCNMDGSDKHIFIIGREKNPICFNNKTIPLPYYSNIKSWMTTSLWNRILGSVNSVMKKQNKKILLIVDNATCHSTYVEFSNIKIQFLPSNTTALIQPLNLGIIRRFKVHYRTNIIRKQLLALDNGLTVREFSKSLSILDALKIVKRAWWLVHPTTIQHSFQKAGFIVEKRMNEENFQNEMIDSVLSEEEFKEYVNCDANLVCFCELTDQEIFEDLTKNIKEGTDCEDKNIVITEENGVIREEGVTIEEALNCIDKLKSYFKKNKINSDKIDDLEEDIITFHKSRKSFKQRSIKKYFH